MNERVEATLSTRSKADPNSKIITGLKANRFVWIFVGFILGGLIIGTLVLYLLQKPFSKASGSLQSIQDLPIEVSSSPIEIEDTELEVPSTKGQDAQTTEMTTSFYLGGTPFVIAQIFSTDEQRIVLQHAWGESHGQFVIETTTLGPCLSGIIPYSISSINKLQYVSEYSCGDSYRAVITTAGLENKSGNVVDRDYEVKEVVQINLNDYFSVKYLENIYEIVGWLDEDLVLVKQKLFEDQESGYISYDEELYIFNVATLEKQLINSRFVEKQ